MKLRSVHRVRLTIMIGCLCLATALSASAPSARDATDRETVARGKVVYAESCAACHGPKGDGQGDAGYLLYPRPRDFTRAVFKVRSTPTGTLPLEDDLLRTISEGMPGTAMPPWKSQLPERDRRALVRYLKTFSKAWKEDPVAQPLDLGPQSEPGLETLALGKRVYGKMSCADCHGEKGKGDGQAVDGMVDSEEVPIVPYDFTLPGRFKGGETPRDIVRTFLTGMDGTPMPSYEGNLSQREAWALAHYVRSLGGTRDKIPPAAGNVITVNEVTGALPTGPMDVTWRRAAPVLIPLRLLWLRKKSAESVAVRGLTNGREIAIMLEWDDPITNARTATVSEFQDAAAIQFALGPVVPFYGMGAHSTPVNIWQWRSARQQKADVQTGDSAHPNELTDEEPFALDNPLFQTARAVRNPGAALRWPSPVEDLNATGFSTLTTQPEDSQDVTGRGLWEGGKWHVMFKRMLSTGHSGDAVLSSAGAVSIAFAVWDGGSSDRDGQKSVTPWQTMKLPIVHVPAAPSRKALILALAAVAVGCFGYVAVSVRGRA